MQTTDYDHTPYNSEVLAQTLPEHLAGEARLFGLEVPDTRTMRVLELGCGEAANILALAATHPNAQFVGVDLSLRQITQAREDRDKLGLTNVELFQLSIADVDENLGQFDYIICHGVYSWVPDEIRGHILRVMKERLKPLGLTYLSYNTLPGWSMRATMRDMMMYHARQYKLPQDQVAQARALGSFLSNALQHTPEWDWSVMVKAEMERLAPLPDWYIFHDNLAPNNHPHWFWEVARDVEAAGLKYVGDTSLRSMIVDHFSPDIVAVLNDAREDHVRLEQYMDFLRCRGFRQSILCHGEREFDRTISAERLEGLCFVAQFEPETPVVRVDDQSAATFKVYRGASITTSDPGMKAVLMAMLEHAPGALDLDALHEVCRSMNANLTREDLASNVITMLSRDALLARSGAVTYAPVSDTPKVFGPARLAVQKGGSFLPNRCHMSIKIGPIDRVVVRLADGTRDIAALQQGVIAAVASGELTVTDNDGNTVAVEDIAPKLLDETKASLAALARLAMLDP